MKELNNYEIEFLKRIFNFSHVKYIISLFKYLYTINTFLFVIMFILATVFVESKFDTTFGYLSIELIIYTFLLKMLSLSFEKKEINLYKWNSETKNDLIEIFEIFKKEISNKFTYTVLSINAISIAYQFLLIFSYKKHIIEIIASLIITIIFHYGLRLLVFKAPKIEK